MSNTISSPAHNITCCSWNSNIFRLFSLFPLSWNSANSFSSHLICFCLNILLQHSNFSNLGITVIHHLIKKFIGNYKIVPQTFILQLFKVLNEDVSNLIEESKDHGNIRIAFSYTYHVNIVNSDPNVSDIFLSEDRLDQSLVDFKDFALEFISNGSAAFTTVVTRYYYFTFLV